MDRFLKCKPTYFYLAPLNQKPALSFPPLGSCGVTDELAVERERKAKLVEEALI